jgi:hypothetical protein
MPRCPECYRILSHRRLDTHLQWCSESAANDPAPGDGLERLANRLNDVEGRIERRIEAIESELQAGPTDEPGRAGTDDLTPPPT